MNDLARDITHTTIRYKGDLKIPITVPINVECTGETLKVDIFEIGVAMVASGVQATVVTGGAPGVDKELILDLSSVIYGQNYSIVVKTDATGVIAKGTLAILAEDGYSSAQLTGTASALDPSLLLNGNGTTINVNKIDWGGTITADVLIDGAFAIHFGSVTNVSAFTVNGVAVATASEIGTIDTEITVIESNITTLDNSITLINSTVGTIQNNITVIESNVTTITSDVTAVESDIGTIQTDVSTNASSIGTINSNITTIDSTIGTLSSGVAANLSSIGTINSSITAINSDIAALANGMIYKDDWDASAGTFPGGGLAQIGWFYNVSVGGTVDSVEFSVGDSIIAKVDDAVTGTYAANWVKKDQTDAVQSVVGEIGTISKSALLFALNVEDGATAGGGAFADLSDVDTLTANRAILWNSSNEAQTSNWEMAGNTWMASSGGSKGIAIGTNVEYHSYRDKTNSFIQGTSQDVSDAVLNIEANIAHVTTYDTGTVAALELRAYGNNGSAQVALVTRPTMRGMNSTTKQWEVAADGTWAYQGNKLTGLADPTAAQDAATKAYVDSGGIVNGGNTDSYTKIKTKVVKIGDWNMDLNAAPVSTVTHGVTLAKIRSVDVLIVNDAGNDIRNLTDDNDPAVALKSYWTADSSNIYLTRKTAGMFDSTNYDTATAYNRGWVTITYEDT